MRPSAPALGLAAVCGIFTALFVALASCKAESRQPTTLIIYYGNETTAAAAQSPNYAILLSSLRTYGGEVGRDIAAAIENDAIISPAIVSSETQALLDACGRLDAGIAVFTNALTQTGRFLYCGPGARAQALAFGGVEPSADDILERTPLSRPEYFRAALERVGGLLSGAPARAILLTHSHGSPGMALMPRVSADVVALDTPTLERILDIRGSSPSWAALKGTNKIDYWRIIGDISRKYRIDFPLVVRQMCESGLYSLAEFQMIPDAVGLIAHTAMADLPYGQIDYRALTAAASARPEVASAVAENLRAQGLPVETKWPFLLRLGAVYLWSVPWALWYAPFVLWLAWLAVCLAQPNLRAKTDARTETSTGAPPHAAPGVTA